MSKTLKRHKNKDNKTLRTDLWYPYKELNDDNIAFLLSHGFYVPLFDEKHIYMCTEEPLINKNSTYFMIHLHVHTDNKTIHSSKFINYNKNKILLEA